MKKGFSLTEILVSIAIIGIISGIGIQTFAISQQRARLEEDVSKVVQAIRKAQNAALAPSRNLATGIGDGDKFCEIIVDFAGENINTQYTKVGTMTLCREGGNYGPQDKLKYARFQSTKSINFEVPFADTQVAVVELELGDLTKKITVTATGLIKVE
jgi:prepilin-type N-terminal cleavage/methylation domain-containing protein